MSWVGAWNGQWSGSWFGAQPVSGPYIDNLYPTPGQPILQADYVRFDVVNVPTGKVCLPFVVVDPLRAPQLAYDGENFCAGFEGTFEIVSLTTHRFSIRQVRGWTSTPSMRVFVGVEVFEL
jgi:hypothetical protein